MTTWNEYISNVQRHVQKLEDAGCDIPFFRGHGDESWALVPALGRKNKNEYKRKNVESILYYDYISQAGSLLPKESSWDVIFSMQHHGLPTRLLDWTEIFAVALYFAIRDFLWLKEMPELMSKVVSPAVWILDPFELNKKTNGSPEVLNPKTDLDADYRAYFIEESSNFKIQAIAITPTKTNSRLIAQKGVFTLHNEYITPLEKICGDVVNKFILEPSLIPDAIKFLELAGINEYSLFPDLDGLSRHLKKKHVDWF